MKKSRPAASPDAYVEALDGWRRGLVDALRDSVRAAAAREEAISYAAYRVLTARFIKSVGGEPSLSEFDDLMDALCYPLDATATVGDSPAAVGNRIAEAVLTYGLTDGSNQAGGYADRISPNGGSVSKRRLLSIEGAGSPGSKTLFDVLLPVAPPRPQG